MATITSQARAAYGPAAVEYWWHYPHQGPADENENRVIFVDSQGNRALACDAEDFDLRVLFSALPATVGQITNVDVNVYTKATTADLWLDYYVDKASLGVVSESPGGSYETITFSTAAWDGPHTREQVNGSYARLEVDFGAGKSGRVWVDHIERVVTYTAVDPLNTYENGGAIRIEDASTITEPRSCRDLLTIPGLAVGSPAGTIDPGYGFVKHVGDGWAQFKAPRSSSYGQPVLINDDASFRLEDGDDPNHAIDVIALEDYLPTGKDESRVYIERAFTSSIVVISADAAAGTDQDFTLYARNYSQSDVENVKVWIDDQSKAFQISPNGVTYTTPLSEDVTTVTADTVHPGGFVAVYCRVCVDVDMPSDSRAFFRLFASWDRY